MDYKLDGLAAVLDRVSRETGTEIAAINRNAEVGKIPFIVIDGSRKVYSAASVVDEFERTQPAPYRRRGIYHAADIESLLGWMNANCDDAAPVFGEGAENLALNWKQPKLALIGIGNYSSKSTTGWHDHQVRYDFPVTLAWRQWVAMSGEYMEQAKFAEFVEQHLYEFSEPLAREDIGEACTRMLEALGGKAKAAATPSKIYDLARGVKLTVEEKVEVALDRATGEATLKFTEEHTGPSGRPVSIPKFFFIRIPVFFGEEPSLIGAMLRYRNAGGGKVVWSYDLFAPDLVVKAAFDKACQIVKTANRTLYLGSPDKP